jgi:hypothetical protein
LTGTPLPSISEWENSNTRRGYMILISSWKLTCSFHTLHCSN